MTRARLTNFFMFFILKFSFQFRRTYKCRVRLYKGLRKPEEMLNLEEIRQHVSDSDDDLKLDVVTLRYGMFIYFTYIGDLEKGNEQLLAIVKDPFEGAFATTKARQYAKARGLI